MNELWNRRDTRVASMTRALAGPAGDARVAILPEQGGGRRQDRGDDTAMEMAGLVVDEALRGLPFSAEWFSAAFDANVAPFYRSFIEVRVEPSKRRVRLLRHGVHGRLHWGDMGVSPGARPSDALPDSPVEWVVEMPRER